MIKVQLKRSEKRAIKLGLLLIGFLVVLNMVVFPFYDRMDAMRQQKQTLIGDLKDIMERLKEAKDLDKQIDRFQRQIADSDDGALQGDSEELAQVSLEELVTNLAKEQGLTVSNSYKERSKQDKYGYLRVATRVTVQGEYPAIVRFLESIQNRPELIAVTDLSLKHYRGYSATVTVMGLAR